jgi:proline iminopeptidase
MSDPNAPRRGFFPSIEPNRSGHLAVSHGHEIYWEECGNPQGKPVVFLHGGPGAGCDARARRFFDPSRYRIFLFDQRGCGRSRPHASLEHNTTWDLVADIERLRETFGVERWQAFGGSWGSTLALAYAEAHPERISELVLRGIFLLRKAELDWFYQEGASFLYPDRWEEYLAPIPQAERHDLVRAFYRRLTGSNGTEAQAAARAWAVWEGATSYLLTDDDNVRKWGEDEFALAVARIECHYFVNGGFMRSESQLLDDIGRIRHIPAVIVQGRHDVVCPMRTAWDLHRAWPEAELQVVGDAGHSAFEPGITDALVCATERFAD